MASQSALRARVATIRELLAPDTSKRPCVSVSINRKAGGPLLLTAGEEPPAETHPPPSKADKRRDGHVGHVCGPRCVEVSINFAPGGGDSTAPEDAGAPSGSGRGDVQRLLESAAVGRDVVDSQSDPPRSPAPAHGPDVGPGDVVLGGHARDAVVELERIDTPAVEYPIGALEIERRREAAAVASALSQDVQSILAWWLPVAEAPLGLCAEPYCSHPAQEHRGIRDRLPCRRCGFRAEQHDPDGIALEVPQSARRVSPCNNYMAIRIDPVDSDRCEHPDCRCMGWRRWVSRDPSDPHVAFADLWAERDRLIAETEREIAELRARIASEQRQGVKPNDYGASPRTCPVFVKGAGT